MPGMLEPEILHSRHTPCLNCIGMPFLQCCNPLIDWVARTVSFGHFCVLALPQHEAAPIEVCSLRSLLKTIHKALATAWFCLLQPRAFCLAMGVSKQP